tara:strand:+ start:1554 stop:1778 length:225 start_codon:yes stop_codon:yes gene_type:complete
MKGSKIIQIADLIEEKLRKEQELEFYEQEMRKLLLRMSFVRQEIGLTETIIKMIENEEIPNLLKNIEKYSYEID